jgi:hypothetical protein
MNLGELEKALHLGVQDESLREYYPQWINNALLELAADYELPALKSVTPTSLAVTTDDWLYDAPADFHKTIFRCANSLYGKIGVCRTMEDLNRLDLDHNETGEHVTRVVATETLIGVYPKASETIYLWYYKKPTALVRAEDVPICIPAAYHARVLLPKTKLVAYELLQDQVEAFDQRGLQYWQAKLAAGINGSPADGVGMLNYLAKIQGGPRRTGGRDPVGVGRRW